MTTILAYGDSLTWGSVPLTGGRHPEGCRWPDVLAAGLGAGYSVVTDALRGRTTGYDEWLADCDRNGVRLFPSVLYAQAPIDLVIIMLGSNDMKPHICGTALGAMQGMRRLLQIVHGHTQGMTPAKRARALVVSPPPLCAPRDPDYAAMFGDRIEESRKVAAMYQRLATDMGAAFFDGGSVAQTDPADGVHLDEKNTKALGVALVPVVQAVLAQTN